LVEAGKALVRVEGFSVAEAVGWSLLPQATLVVIDGPNDEGFLLARIDGHGIDRAPPDWDTAVADHGGAWLLADGQSIFAPLVD
jgi:hypothetical protein